MKRHGAPLPAALAAAFLAIAAGPAAAEPRAVIELFTSQGCSSCPPADRLLGELARDPQLVAMSLPIDYWDYIGWKDTLAKPRHAARQRFYARTRGDGDVFTPQVVINGVTHAVGSDEAAIEQAIVESRRDAATLSLPVKLALADGTLSVTVLAADPEAGEAASGEVWLCALAKEVPVTIARGENQGRTVTYHNVVRRWVKLGDWNGATRSFSVPASDFAPAEAVAVIVQGGTADRPGRMLGAAMASVD
jgi:hypothetical protein